MEEEAPNIRSHLEGIATDAVHLARYSNAAVIDNLNLINRLKVIDKNVDTVSNNKTVS